MFILTFASYSHTNPKHVPFGMVKGVPTVSNEFFNKIRNELNVTHVNVGDAISYDVNDAIAKHMFDQLKERLFNEQN